MTDGVRRHKKPHKGGESIHGGEPSSSAKKTFSSAFPGVRARLSEAAKRADHEQGGMGHNRAYSKERLRPYSEVGKGRDIVKDSLQLCEYTVRTVLFEIGPLRVR